MKNLKINDYVYQLGQIEDIYENQFKINGQWYNKRIIEEALLNEKIYKITPIKVKSIICKMDKNENDIKILKKNYEIDCQAQTAEKAPMLHNTKSICDFGHIMNNIRIYLKVA